MSYQEDAEAREHRRELVAAEDEHGTGQVDLHRDKWIEGDTPCKHERLHQFSTIYARTDWTRQENGSFEPDEVPCSKVLSEETDYFECADCGAHVWLGENQEIADDEVTSLIAQPLDVEKMD